MDKLSPSPPKLVRSQRLSPSTVTLEHLVACVCPRRASWSLLFWSWILSVWLLI